MSGSSLDGLDLVVCRFEEHNATLQWALERTEHVPLPPKWVDTLLALPNASGKELIQQHVAFGHFLGQQIDPFIRSTPYSIDAIASHGHTIHHYPGLGFTFQLGDGAAIAAETGIQTIDNFRQQDISLGGQGAPLAPMVESLLFPDHRVFLNLGGIANISVATPHTRIGLDVSACNQVFNALAQQRGMAYDQDGQLCAAGKPDAALLVKLDSLAYYSLPAPKSLGNDWVQNQFIPIVMQHEASVEDKMHTCALHLIQKIEAALVSTNCPPGESVFTTGGGAHNTQFIELMSKHLPWPIHRPSHDIIDYKEAILMALLGYLRLSHLPTCLPSVTGASRAASSGGVHASIVKS